MGDYLIGLTGGAGSGKSTAAGILVQQYGFTQIAFADPLKDMLRVMFRSMGWDDDKIEAHIGGTMKEVTIPELGMTTSRYMQQSLGTEWGRDRVYQRLWVVLLESRLSSLVRAGVTRIVVDDVRMLNEADAILRPQLIGWQTGIWRTWPEGTPRRQPGDHRSEVGLPIEYVTADLVHDYSMGSLQKQIDAKIIAPWGINQEGPWHHGKA